MRLRKLLAPLRAYFRKSLMLRLKIPPGHKDADKIIGEFLKEQYGGER